MTPMSVTRRSFLGAMSAAAWHRVLGANDRVQVGFIGYGLIGAQHVYDFKNQRDVDLATGEWKLVKRQPVPNYDPAKYEVERIWATAKDGVRIPVALVHKKGVPRDGKAPLYLYAYGSYGAAIPDFFPGPKGPRPIPKTGGPPPFGNPKSGGATAPPPVKKP